MKITLVDLRILRTNAIKIGNLENWSELILDFTQQAVDEIKTLNDQILILKERIRINELPNMRPHDAESGDA